MAERIYVALDLETTGLDPAKDAIIEIGAVRFQGNRILDKFVTFVNPQRSIPLRVQQITSIDNSDVAKAPKLAEITPEFLAFIGPDVAGVVAHNAAFDLQFLRNAGIHLHRPAFDTFELASILLPGMVSYSLGALCDEMAIRLTDAHRALADATATALLFAALETKARALPRTTLQAILESGGDTQWSPLQLFADAMQQAKNHLDHPPPLSGEVDNAIHFAPESLLLDRGADPQLVEQEAIDHFLAPQGFLAQQMGDGYEVRKGQIEMAHRVMDGLNMGDHLIVEAGTGTGKSLAYLLPAALWSVANGRRVVIATNTITLQDQLIEKDIPQVQALCGENGHVVPHVAILKGRTNYLCTRRLHLWRKGHRLNVTELRVFAKIAVWYPTTETGDVNELFLPTPEERAIWLRVCSDAMTCNPQRCTGAAQTLVEGVGFLFERHQDFFWRARQRAESAHLLIINHALLLADVAAGGKVLVPYSHLVVDEAHHLEEAATDQLAHRIEWGGMQMRLKRLMRQGDLVSQIAREMQLNQQIEQISERVAKYIDALSTLSSVAEQASRQLSIFADSLVQFVKGRKGIRKDVGYVQRLAIDGGVRTQPAWDELEMAWEDVSRSLQRCLQALHTLVQHLEKSQWHTQEPKATYVSELESVESGLGDDLTWLDEIILHQPAVHRHQQQRSPNRPGHAHGTITWLELNERSDQVSLLAAPLYVGELLEKALIRKLRSVVITGATLRTSDDFDFIKGRLGLWDVSATAIESPFNYAQNTLLYMPTDLSAPNEAGYQQSVDRAIINAVQATGGRTLVLFTSYGQLRTTADGIRAPLDQQGITVLQHGTSSRRRLLREYRHTEKAVLLGTRSFWEGIDLPGDELKCLLIVRLPFSVPSDPLVAARSEECENAFRDYTLPDAVLRFRQGFGRLIRRASDSGVVVLLDNRVWRKPYGQAFLDALPTCTERHAPIMNLSDEIEEWLNRS